MSRQTDPRWNRFFCHFQKDLKLWLFFVLILMLERWVFLLVFRQEIVGDHIVASILASLVRSISFDVMASSYWMIVPWIVSLLFSIMNWGSKADRFRIIWGGIFLFTTVWLSILSIEYYREYHNTFNLMLFKVGEDDTKAILSTLYADYHPISYAVLSLILTVAGVLIYRRYFTKQFVSEETFIKYISSGWRRLIVSLAVILLVVFGIRGSFDYRPIQVKDAGVTDNRFLNKAVLNPYMALLEAVNAHCLITGEDGLHAYLPDGDIRGAVQRAYPEIPEASNIDQCMEHVASGPRVTPPRHIFLMQLESYDAWPLLDKYSSLRLVENGRRFAKEGLHLTSFLPSGGGTIETYCTLISGLPFTSLQLHLEIAGQETLPTSLPETFRRLGYRTRFFYSGFLSWQNVGDFSTSQGFDEVYGIGHAAPGAVANEWGLADQYFFDLVEKTVNDDRPSFNFLMTTGYHPPYNFDLKALGVEMPTVPPELEPEFHCDRPKMLNILGHLRYADQSLGRFVDNMETKLPLPLFAITGDHHSRRFINANPTLFECSAVPLILYGKTVLGDVRFPENTAGSHVDIGPTLVEMVASKGFHYKTMGRNLLEPPAQTIAYNSERIIGPDFMVALENVNNFQPMPDRPLPEKLPDSKALHDQVLTLQGIAWWRIHKGARLPHDTVLSKTGQTSVTR
jgi:phosphoglycerol transferase MdoB-like AlkP superfamily enzyme